MKPLVYNICLGIFPIGQSEYATLSMLVLVVCLRVWFCFFSLGKHVTSGENTLPLLTLKVLNF